METGSVRAPLLPLSSYQAGPATVPARDRDGR